MKKFLAILLAMMLVLVTAMTFALAEEGTPGGDDGNTEGGNTEGDATQVVSIDPATASAAAGNPTEPVTVKIKKSITSVAEEDVYVADDRHPEVTLKFSAVEKSVALSTVTEAPEVTFKDLTIEEDDDSGYLEINLPSYEAVGIYTYTVTETPTGFAGMTEAANLELKVTVIQNVDTGNLEIAGIAVRQDNVKTDDIENLYKAGRLLVTKIVDGNMGDRTKEFPITVTLNAPSNKTVASTVTYKVNDGDAQTVTFTDGKAEVKVNLKHNEFVEVLNIPEGVTYTVVEDEDITHLDAPDGDDEDADAYMVEGEEEEDTEITVGERTEYEITNTKAIVPDTGISLESLPYVLMMALAVFGFVVLKLRKREEY